MIAPAKRKHVFYSGRVQGVGFRYTAVRIARQFDVTGLVRNLPDGRVELIAEGDPKELRGFLKQLAETMQHNIDGREVIESDANGEFENFDIRF